MEAFEYASPASVQEAVALLGTKWEDAAPLAGGTDLLNVMKDYVYNPKRVVNIKGIKELSGIQKTANGVRIGATTTIDELMQNAAIKADYPSLFQAAQGIHSMQIRNMGTVGGDLCQRPRCWYFRGGHGLLGQDANGKSLVTEGENRYHAIFGGGPAYFVSASSFGPALAALGASVKLTGPSGSREVALDKFFVVPQNGAAREIALLPNEILTEITIPSARNRKNATYEVRHREAIDWPLATASVALDMNGNRVNTAKIRLGHVAPTPWTATQAEKALAGTTISPEVAEQAAQAAVADAKPLSQNGYKVQLTRVAVKRALLTAAGLQV